MVDERSEIAACHRGIPQNDLGPRTDVLDNCPKEQGMRMLLRSMSPEVIAVDELGTPEDFAAVYDCARCGISVLGTIHAGDKEEVIKRLSGNGLSQILKECRLVGLKRLGDGKRKIMVYDGKGDSIAEMNRNLKGRKAPMQEIKEEENESKMVLETIRMPKKLIYLNKHLPTANYDTDQNEDEVNKIKNIKNLSFPNKMLPKIANNRYMNNILHNNNEIVKSAGDMKINTIHLKILKNNKGMFNLGKINTIIEEEEEIKKRHRINSRSVNKMKDLRFIYKPYIPQILSNQRTLKNNLSEKSIFGNLNYSFNQNLIKKPDTKSSSDIVMLKLKKRKLIPIVKFKRKGE